jgi:hypothetical protein
MEWSLGMVSHGSEDYVCHSYSPLLRFYSCSCTMEYSARCIFGVHSFVVLLGITHYGTYPVDHKDLSG